MSLNDTFTSTGAKFFAHQEVMTKLRNGQGQPVVTHVMLTDICQHTCAFCSVQARAGDSLAFDAVMAYLDILMCHGLKAVILSGGGNPILYKCKACGADFNDVVDAIHRRGLEIGLITNGMPLKQYKGAFDWEKDRSDTFPYSPKYPGWVGNRRSWLTVRPETLDKLTWMRISMAGLDHEEGEVYVPDIDPAKTTLGFSYVGHDIFYEPLEPHHGKVSRPLDLVVQHLDRIPDLTFEERIEELTDDITGYVLNYAPKYVRLLPNCLEPELIPRRCEQLQSMAHRINLRASRDVVFVQNKPPKAPKACLLGVIHPVLNCDGYVFPCDSCVLNESAGHKFGMSWRICHWSDIGKLYENKLPSSLIGDPSKQCPGCVFSRSNEILVGVRDGTIDPVPPLETPEHFNFV